MLALEKKYHIKEREDRPEPGFITASSFNSVQYLIKVGRNVCETSTLVASHENKILSKMLIYSFGIYNGLPQLGPIKNPNHRLVLSDKCARCLWNSVDVTS
ncbi:hypothetical protein V1477_020748 [Vespula maculifrons]|uniref:Uncharacterized protein n=1 Tax=Vespula maculifrons TaxID=7453 RepID=A0ABD2AMT0_VESMC